MSVVTGKDKVIFTNGEIRIIQRSPQAIGGRDYFFVGCSCASQGIEHLPNTLCESKTKKLLKEVDYYSTTATIYSSHRDESIKQWFSVWMEIPVNELELIIDGKTILS